MAVALEKDSVEEDDAVIEGAEDCAKEEDVLRGVDDSCEDDEVAADGDICSGVDGICAFCDEGGSIWTLVVVVVDMGGGGDADMEGGSFEDDIIDGCTGCESCGGGGGGGGCCC